MDLTNYLLSIVISLVVGVAGFVWRAMYDNGVLCASISAFLQEPANSA
jgi:hypothetical protein